MEQLKNELGAWVYSGKEDKTQVSRNQRSASIKKASNKEKKKERSFSGGFNLKLTYVDILELYNN